MNNPPSTVSRQFLDAMYQRLHEAQRGMFNASNKDSRENWDGLRCCIHQSINDYLAAHAPWPKDPT